MSLKDTISRNGFNRHMESAISKIKPVFFCKDLTITEFSLCLVAEYEHMQDPLVLLKMLAQSQQAVSSGKTVSSADAYSRLRAQRGLT